MHQAGSPWLSNPLASVCTASAKTPRFVTMINMLGIGDWPHPSSAQFGRASMLFVIWLLVYLVIVFFCMSRSRRP